MSRALNYILVSLLIIGLVLIRFFEDTLFYDPYLTFFQIIPEERALTKLFGEEFTAYKARVKRWL